MPQAISRRRGGRSLRPPFPAAPYRGARAEDGFIKFGDMTRMWLCEVWGRVGSGFWVYGVLCWALRLRFHGFEVKGFGGLETQRLMEA